MRRIALVAGVAVLLAAGGDAPDKGAVPAPVYPIPEYCRPCCHEVRCPATTPTSDAGGDVAEATPAKDEPQGTDGVRFADWATALVAALTLPIAAAAVFQAFTARDTARRQLRAYLHVEKVMLNWDKNGEPRLGVYVQNTGQTPATEFQIRSCIKLDGDLNTRDYVVPGSADLGFARWAGVGAGCTRDNGLWPLNPDLLTSSNIKNQPEHICVLGRVQYRDIFGCHLETEFAAFIDPADVVMPEVRMPNAGAKLEAFRLISAAQYKAAPGAIS